MKNWLSAFYRSLGADTLKLRRTPALALAVILPVLPPLLFFVYVLQFGNKGTPEDVDPVSWTVMGILSIWAGILALFVAIETSLLADIEHRSGGWKHLFSLSVRRSAVYTAKFTAAGILMGIATVSISGYTLLSLWSLSGMRAEVGFDVPLPIWETFLLFALIGAASLFLVAVHGFIALRWSSFALNVGLALAGLLGSFVFLESRLLNIYPWSIPNAIQNLAGPMVFGWGTRGTPADVFLIMSLALAAAALATFLGVWMLSRRDVL